MFTLRKSGEILSTVIYFIIIFVVVGGVAYASRNVWVPKLKELAASVHSTSTPAPPQLSSSSPTGSGTNLSIGSITTITPLPIPSILPTATPLSPSPIATLPRSGHLPTTGPSGILGVLGLLVLVSSFAFSYYFWQERLRKQWRNLEIR